MGKKSASPSSEKRVIGKFCLQLLVLYVAVNFVVQIVRKPTEIASFLSFAMYKTPQQTWNAYRNYFTSAATEATPAEFLAALAHTESNGNPWASPGWRFKWNAKVFDFYAPATSAVGLYQFLDDTFRSVGIGAAFSYRLSPQSSTQIAAAYLNREISRISIEQSKKFSPEKKQILAAVIHLCGKGKAVALARNGFNWSAIGSCGAHQPQAYTQKIMSLKKTFSQLASMPERSIASIR